MSRNFADLPRWWALVFAALALTLYANTLDHPFVGDDGPLILRNPTIAQRSLIGLRRLWTTPYLTGIRPDGSTIDLAADHNGYRPVTTVSCWLNAWPCGLSAPCFRVVNIMLLALAAWLVGLLASRWGGASAGLIAGGIMLVHPAGTDLVNRMVGRSEILVVAGMAGFLAAQRAAQRSTWTWPRTLGAALAAAVALGAKESGIVLVPLAVLHEWLGRAPDGRTSGNHRRADHMWRGVLALAIPFAIYVILRLVAVGSPHFDRSPYDLLESPLSQAALATRVPATLTLAGDYLRMLLGPWPLMALDFPARFPTWGDIGTWVGLGILAAVVVGTAWTTFRRGAFALPLAWCLLSFLVVSHLIVPTWTYREVRLAYPMLAGMAPAIGWLVVEHCFRRTYTRAAALSVLVVAALVCAALVVARNPDWKSDLAIAEADGYHDPLRPSAQSKLGDMLDRAERPAEAERAYKEAARLAPASYQVWYQLAGFYERRGRVADARQAYQRAATVDPTLPFAFVGLGLLAMHEDHLEEAQQQLARAEHADPDDPFAQYNLAVVDDWRGQHDDAVARLRRLTQRHPEFRPGVEGLAAMTVSSPSHN